MNLVHLPMSDPSPPPLGIDICYHQRGEGTGGTGTCSGRSITVTKFQPGGQAEGACKRAMLGPDSFRGATILGVDGHAASDALCRRLLNDDDGDEGEGSRPKSILFRLQKQQKDVHDIRDAVNVHKLYDTRCVELVFRERVMGIVIDRSSSSDSDDDASSSLHKLKVGGFKEGTEAISICRNCLFLDPQSFVGATIVRVVNGERCASSTNLDDDDDDYETRNGGLYEALKSSERPKSVLFELVAAPTPAPPSPRTAAKAISAGQSHEEKAMFKTAEPSKNQQEAAEDLAATSNRRASLQLQMLRDRASFASTSLQNLQEAVAATDDDGDRGGRTTTEDRPRIVRDRDLSLALLANVSESMRKLERRMAEMETMNAATDRENALNLMRSSVEAALSRSQSSVDDAASVKSGDTTTSTTTPRSSARKILQGLRRRSRFKRRTDSGRSVDEDPGDSASSIYIGDIGKLRRDSTRSVDYDTEPGSSSSVDIDVGNRSRTLSLSSNRSIDIDEMFETEEDKAAALDQLKNEAHQACLHAIRQHLEAFLSDAPDVTYEEWIEELHPENARSKTNLVGDRSIDHRFYMEDSDHRMLWNETLDEEDMERGGPKRQFVPVMDYLPSSEAIADGQQHQSESPVTPKTLARSPPVGGVH